jgi:N-acetylglucosamine-6-phosphate deacetylase
VPTKAEVGEILARSHGAIVRWDAAPELDGMHEFAKQVGEQGILLSVGHSVATAEETLAAYADGFSHITHMYCATTTEHKRGQVVHGGIVEAAYLEDGITIELIADGKHIPKETMRLGFRLKGDDRLALITDAMRAAGTDLTETMLGDRKNGVPVIIEEGVAKLPDRTSYAGSIATMDHALRVVHSRYGLPLCDTVRAMTLTPARLVGADERKGSIAPGKDADLVILSPDLEVRRVFVRGKEFTK